MRDIRKKSLVVYAFIDSQNLIMGVKSQGWRLDFAKFYLYLKTKYQIRKAVLFIGFIPKNKMLYNKLSKIGYLLVYKPTLEIKKGKRNFTKGNVDAELVLHSMIEWDNYDQAVIVSGDGDFYCLINHLNNYKKLAKIITPNKNYSSLLRKFASHIVSLNLLKRKLCQK